MHNSSETKIIKQKLIKRSIIIVLMLICVILINELLNFIFIPYGYIRVDYHNAYESEHDVVYIGTSHGKCSISPEIIDGINGGNSVNMCLGGEYLCSSYYILKDICNSYTPEKVVYELDYGYWVTNEYTGTDSMLLYREMRPSWTKAEYFMDKMFSKDFRTALFPWYVFRKEYSMIPSNIQNKLNGAYENYDTSVFNSEVQTYKEGGFIYKASRPDEVKDFTNFTLWDESHVNKNAKDYFEKIVRLCREKGIELTVIITPVPEVTFNMYEDMYDDCNEYFSELCADAGVEFYNFNYMDLGDFDKSLMSYYDYEGHMIGTTAEKFSEILAGYCR